MKPKRPTHCKGCPLFHSAGRKDPLAALRRYNSWCCHFGREASKAVGHCKQIGFRADKEKR